MCWQHVIVSCDGYRVSLKATGSYSPHDPQIRIGDEVRDDDAVRISQQIT